MKAFLIDMAERAIKTAAQVAIATIGVSTTMSEVNWTVVASTVCVATILSLLSSIASMNIGDTLTASLVSKESEVE